MKFTHTFGIACAALLLSSTLARAEARLVSVTPLDGGCVAGPTGPSVQFWDLEPGRRYEFTLTNVTECGNGGTAPTINIRVNMSGGNVDLVATRTGPGQYVFSLTIPLGFTCTGPIFYCTTAGNPSTGLFVQRSDGGKHQAHVRAATFGPGCTNPTTISGPGCATVFTFSRRWGQVKDIYR